MKLVYLPEANEDLDRLYFFLLEKDPHAAIQAMESIDENAKLLVTFPELGISLDDGTERRELYISFGKGAYTLRYKIDDITNHVVISRIWHSKEERTV